MCKFQMLQNTWLDIYIFLKSMRKGDVEDSYLQALPTCSILCMLLKSKSHHVQWYYSQVTTFRTTASINLGGTG